MAGDSQLTITLTARQLEQLNAIRGDRSPGEAASAALAEWLDGRFPVGRALPQTVRLQTTGMFQRGGFGYPAPVSDYPSIEELVPAIPIALPPKVEGRGGPGGARGDKQSSRWAAERAIWMIAQENAGWPWKDIAEYWGYERTDFAQAVVNRYLMLTQAEVAATRRERQRAVLETLLGYGMQKLEHPPYLYDIKGSPVRSPEGGFALDEAQRTRDIEAMLKVLQRLARNDGSDAAESVKIQSGMVDIDNKIRDMMERVKTAALKAAAVQQGQLEAGEPESEDPAA